MVPAWRIATPEGTFLILTPFDTDKTEQRNHSLFLISRFMAWKMATSFVHGRDVAWRREETRRG